MIINSLGHPICFGNANGLTFQDDCCSNTRKCGEGQGGCKEDDDCADNSDLVCGYCDDKTNFPAGAKCCKTQGMYFILLISISNRHISTIL